MLTALRWSAKLLEWNGIINEDVKKGWSDKTKRIIGLKNSDDILSGGQIPNENKGKISE